MLQMKNVKKKYPGFELEADIRVLPGRITGLIGQNGAGKSTLFKIALGLVYADSVEIEILGKPLGSFTDRDKQSIGAVLADAGFSGYITLGDVSRILEKFYPDFSAPEFLKKCEKFGLPANKPIREFSTGMKAKLKVLTALSHNAKLLILDEPTAGLDVIARDDILDLLRGFIGENDDRSILISSHISTDLETLCDDFYMIHEGKIILHEDTDRLLGDYAILKVSEEQFGKLDKQYLLRIREESFGYSCLTDERRFYLENYPETVIEKSGIDELIQLMIKGKSL